MRTLLIPGLAIVLGLLLLANGGWMLAGPEGWYWEIPGVPDRGPFNQHFVRDIGIIYALCGAGLVLGGLYPAQRLALWWAPAFWLTGHALFHVWEVAVGLCGPASLLEDFVGVTLPAIASLVLLWVAYAGASTRAH